MPPNRRVVEASAWSNLSNSCVRLSGGDADAGVGDRRAPGVRRRGATRRRAISPCSVNFRALEIRL